MLPVLSLFVAVVLFVWTARVFALAELYPGFVGERQVLHTLVRKTMGGSILDRSIYPVKNPGRSFTSCQQ